MLLERSSESASKLLGEILINLPAEAGRPYAETDLLLLALCREPQTAPLLELHGVTGDQVRQAMSELTIFEPVSSFPQASQEVKELVLGTADEVGPDGKFTPLDLLVSLLNYPSPVMMRRAHEVLINLHCDIGALRSDALRCVQQGPMQTVVLPRGVWTTLSTYLAHQDMKGPPEYMQLVLAAIGQATGQPVTTT